VATANDSEGQLQQEVDASLKEWRQGDCVLSEQYFVHRFAPQCPLTDASKQVSMDDIDLADVEVLGFTIATQTCDIVRSCLSRPFIEVVPLVEVEKQKLREIQRGQQSRYAFIPNLAEKSLIADLDRVMTVEKAVVAQWDRISGCSTDEERRALGQAFARKRNRFAFPDDFTEFSRKLQNRLREKHNKSSIEGDALRALREIRVRASPSWDDPEIELTFWFIRNGMDSTFKGMGWHELLEKWLDLVSKSGRFQSVVGQVITLENLSAKDYVESDPLDLDYLSTSS
jgi:hypothetical protein